MLPAPASRVEDARMSTQAESMGGLAELSEPQLFKEAQSKDDQRGEERGKERTEGERRGV